MLLAYYSLYYIALEPFAGVTWTGCMALPMWAGANAMRQAVPDAWAWALGLHVASWFFQVSWAGVEPEMCGWGRGQS